MPLNRLERQFLERQMHTTRAMKWLSGRILVANDSVPGSTPCLGEGMTLKPSAAKLHQYVIGAVNLPFSYENVKPQHPLVTNN